MKTTTVWLRFGVLWLWACSGIAAAAPPLELPEPQALHVTGGAAPGYVDDKLCGTCHAGLWDSYQEVAMSQSFYRPSPERVIEDFANAHYYHVRSDRHYELHLRDGDYVFVRYQLDADGEPINRFERKVDWIMGSGRHVRTYLYQTEAGELYQLPLAWYGQTGTWGMQPGYDRPDHQGVLRRIRRECMFCHNAYPEVPAGSDRHYSEHRYPHQLPEGTGCQRCHGPGGEHVRLLLEGSEDLTAIRSAIVNPGKLSPQRRDEVCYECHMLPAVATPPVRRFDRADYSFRPGQALADYAVSFDVEVADRKPVERFEINHHPYRLRQSRCYQEGEGGLNCLSCHDPHRKVPAAERAAHYRAVCEGCHADLQHPPQSGQSLEDCVACHMPLRRTHDVVQVMMTDHRIQLPLPEEERVGEREEEDPVLVDVRHLDPEQAPAGDLGEIYRTLAVLRPTGGLPREGIDYLAKLLERSPVDSPVPYLDLTEFRLKAQRFAEAEESLAQATGRGAPRARVEEWRALALAGRGEHAPARALLERLAEQGSERAEVWFNLGLLRYQAEALEAAGQALERSLALRPNQVRAWYYLGRVQADRGDTARAVESFRQALAYEPTDRRSYDGIIAAYEALADGAGAERYRRQRERAAPSRENGGG